MFTANDLSNAKFILDNQRSFTATNRSGETIVGFLYSDSDMSWAYDVISFFKRVHKKAQELASIGITYCEAFKIAYQIASNVIEDIVSEVIHKYRVFERKMSEVQKKAKTMVCNPSDAFMINHYNELRVLLVSRASKYRHRQECRDKADRMQSIINYK